MEPLRSPVRVGLRAVMAGVALGALLAIAAGIALFIWYYRESTPRLTRAAIEEAKACWESRRPANYDLDVRLSGAQQAAIHVEVRNGQVTAMTYDDRPPRNRTTWDAWSIDGLFEMMARELEIAEDPRPHGISDPSQVVLRAEFDPELGYPRKFQRVVMGTGRSPGSGEIRWQVTRFEPVSTSER